VLDYVTTEDIPLNIAAAFGLTRNSTDPDTGETDLLVVSDVEGIAIPSGGATVTLASGSTVTVHPDGSFLYTPFLDLSTSDSFSFTVKDPGGLSSNATATVTIGAINDAPVAANDLSATNEDTPLEIATASLIANDSDPDLDPVSFAAVVSQPTNGQLSPLSG